MIVLQCSQCGGYKLHKSRYNGYFKCEDCNEELPLWKIHFNDVPINSTKESATTISFEIAKLVQ